MPEVSMAHKNITLAQVDAALATCAKRRAEVKDHDPDYAELLMTYADAFLDDRLKLQAAS